MVSLLFIPSAQGLSVDLELAVSWLRYWPAKLPVSTPSSGIAGAHGPPGQML